MGHKISMACQQQRMSRVLGSQIGSNDADCCYVYVDDVISAAGGPTKADALKHHVNQLEEILAKFKEDNVYLNPKKCEYVKREILYVGHVVSEKGCRINPEKQKAFLLKQRPASAKEMRNYLGAVTWLSKFIPNFSARIKPLTAMTNVRQQQFRWGDQQEAAFRDLQTAVSSAPCLAPWRDEAKTILATDASTLKGFGAVLLQGPKSATTAEE